MLTTAVANTLILTRASVRHTFIRAHPKGPALFAVGDLSEAAIRRALAAHERHAGPPPAGDEPALRDWLRAAFKEATLSERINSAHTSVGNALVLAAALTATLVPAWFLSSWAFHQARHVLTMVFK